ncbi:MAG: NusG domain II-containing protein [Gammaproteobacteria bacterium]|nr:NusG domain II-containing protein [Gammaproteobacteria bacterium]
MSISPLRSSLTRADVILLFIAAGLIGWLYMALWAPDSTALEVEIWSRGQRVQTLSLAENHRIEVTGALGVSLIEIKDAQVRFVDSPCSNKLCVHSGWQRHAGETTACLPNQVSVRILGRDRRYDAINF